MLRETLAGSPDETVLQSVVWGMSSQYRMAAGSGREGGSVDSGRQRLTRKGGEVNAFAVWHGQAAWSLSRQHTGTTEIALTGNGRRRADAASAPRTDVWARFLQPDA